MNNEIEKNPLMNNGMRARSCYAAAVCLYQSPSVEDHEMAIELLDKSVDLYPDFSEPSTFRAEIWSSLPAGHCYLY